MTRISKRIISWILGAFAFVALAFGTVFAMPQVNTAKAADTAVNFNVAYLEGDSNGYAVIRMDTEGQTWATYHNELTVSALPSVANYTVINGRTLTEIQNTSTVNADIKITLQPAGTFSFIRAFIPLEIMTTSQIKSVGILNGWALNNGTNNYTSPAVTFIRQGDTLVKPENYTTSNQKLTSANITISDAQLVHRVHSSRGADSYMVDINLGQSFGEYDAMYNGFKTVRDFIYINGKSIEEWNAQAIAADARFNEPSTYTYFPQNSTDSGHKEWFVKPIGLWGTSTGFRLSIFQELVADLETVTVSIGAGCVKDGSFVVVENISKTVLTQNVVNITGQLSFLDNSKHNPADWGETKLYFIHTNNQAGWTKSPKGGCLNEYDPSDAGGGQIQMKYVYFNGTSLYDINKNDNGAYGSTQGNIANGGIYAPILVSMSSELGSALKLTVPTNFTNGKAGHEEIVIKKGFNVKEGDTSYVVTSDVTFTNNGTTAWTKEIKATEIETEVTNVITRAVSQNENFVIFELSNNDYAGLNTEAIVDISGVYGYIDINGNVVNSKPAEPFFNVWGISNSVAFRAPGLTAADLQQVRYITIKAGAKFPAYSTQSGGRAVVFVTTEDVTFVHDVPNDTWTIGAVPSANHTVTFTVDGETYATQTVAHSGNAVAPNAPTKADDANYTYTFKQWTLGGVAYNFATPVTSDITLVAEFTATPVDNEVDVTSEISLVHQAQQYAGTDTYLIKTINSYWTKSPKGGCLNEADPQNAGGGQEQMKYIYFNGTSLYDINKNDNNSYGSVQGNIASGGIYAPILVTMGTDGGRYSYIQIHVPTLYGGEGATADENHKSFELKAGFSVTENGQTYKVTKNIKWVNLGGVWYNEDSLIPASNVSIGNAVIGGEAGDQIVVEITSNDWGFPSTRDPFDYNYYGSEVFVAMRKNIFINGVSIFEINTTVDDSAYEYVTSPQTNTHQGEYNGVMYDTFANPVYLYGKGNSLKIHIFKEYLSSLNEKEITLTVGAGFVAYDSDALAEDVSKVITTKHTVVVDGLVQEVYTGGKVIRPATPEKDMTSTTIFVFENWYDVATNQVFDFENTVIDRDYTIEARFTEHKVVLNETTIKFASYHINEKKNEDRWFYIVLNEHDYDGNVSLYSFNIETIRNSGLVDKIIIKGDITLGGKAVTEATLGEIFNQNGTGEAIYMNLWADTKPENVGSIAFRTMGVSSIKEVVVEAGAFFPSYQYMTGKTTEETYYVLSREVTLINNSEQGLTGYLLSENEAPIDIQMASGAAVRITSDMATSGIRFQTKIAKTEIETLQNALNNGEYKKVEFGTLIVPNDYLMGGLFTHEWLDKNGFNYLDIPSTAGISNGFPVEDRDYYSYFGSIVKLKEENYNRKFVGVGYIKITDSEDNVSYFYASYDSTNSRSAAYIANAAINDRKDSKEGNYQNYISENNNYSIYTEKQNKFLESYLVQSGVTAVSSQDLTELSSKGGEQTITPTTKALNGPYVELVYSTNVNVWGVFTYTDGNKTANEDFYLQAGTTNHKQYLDIFRYNGVGYGMNADNLSMTSIKFINAELKQEKAGEVKILALYSQNKTVDMEKQEIYLTVEQADGSEMTVGAHLGLGGALTYLAKSGIYEGVVGQTENSSFNQDYLGYTKYKANTGNVVLSEDPSIFDESHATGNRTSEAGYYGHATSSKAADGAVNLINNVDAGRQIQQSWYASVGGDSTGAGNGSNGYTRAFCKTESAAGKYWPYNPVQAGDVVSNPSQIVDYDIVITNQETGEGYIYVKTRAMDWAKGLKSSDVLANTIEGGSTTKSYMENYYRLNADGTLTVNNSYIDWNGFTDMELCDWASTELPAVYPVHTLNYYVSNIDGDGSWNDALEYRSDLGGWTGDQALRQFSSASRGDTKVEDWFAWANGGSLNSFAMGIYIPNVERLTSGRARTETALTNSLNRDAKSDNVLYKKGLMSNMQPIEYTYQSTYVSNTSYTAPGVDFRMEAYKPIEYSYVICLGSISEIRSTFKTIKDKGMVTNAGSGYEKIGLDAWARADKMWTW